MNETIKNNGFHYDIRARAAWFRDMVTSPGGTTEAGLAVFDPSRPETVIDAIHAACERSREISRELERQK